MLLAAMQPHFLPWCGYIALLDFVDEFIILDDIQFDKRSRQQRNTINVNGNPFIITIPVLSKKKFNQNINEVEIYRDSNFVKKQKKTIYDAYSKKPFFEEYYDHICQIYDKNHKFLIDLNIEFIELFIDILSINTKLIFKSSLNVYRSL